MADQFNATSSVYFREWLVLRTLWENLKKKAKIVIVLQYDNLYETGGGKAKTIVQDPIILRIITLIRPQVDALPNEFDDDHIENTTPTLDQSDKDDTTEDQHQANLFGMKRNAANDWSHYNPSMLKAPCAPALRAQNQNFEMSAKVINNEVVYEKADILDLPSVSSQDPPSVSKNNNQTLRQTVVADSSRRRPLLKRPQTEAKLLTLTSATQEATKEHEITIQILGFQLELEKVRLEVEKKKLIQEKLKTKILKFELDKKIGVAWDVE